MFTAIVRCVVAASVIVLSLVGGASAQGTFDRQALIEGARKEGKFVLYATIGEEQANQLVKRFQAKYPFIQAESFRANSGRLKARLDAELASNRVLGDTLQMGSFGQFLAYAKAGMLDRFETPEMAAYPAAYKEQGVWTIFRNSPILMAYSARRLPDGEAPKRWSDLLDPRFKGQLAMLDSTSGGQQIHWYTLRKKYGTDFWSKVAANTPIIVPGPNQVIDGLLTGEFKVAAHTYGYTIKEYEQNGAPVKAIVPADGVPMLVSPIGIIKGAPHPFAARLFIDWILSQEGQTQMVEIMNDYSPRSDVKPPAGLPPWDKIDKLIPDDWAAFVQSTPEFTKEWDQMSAKRK
jgi:iron(III) transport system substrate-binding protein